MRNCSRLRRLYESYLTARERLVNLGFGPEIDWQESRRLSYLSEKDFLEQTAWTILSGGFRETVVRRVFPDISAAFLNWTKATSIAKRRAQCEKEAMRVFNHTGKIRAIGSACACVAEVGFDQIVWRIQSRGVEFLRTFAFVGPVTCYHLAKNIGLDVVKPDRHLVRLAKATDFRSPVDLCRAISEVTGDRLAVVDIVLWRYATVTKGYVERFVERSASPRKSPQGQALRRAAI